MPQNDAIINSLIFRAAWRSGYQLLQTVTAAQPHLWSELVQTSFMTTAAPDLGDYTVPWQPLTEAWITRKGFDSFYYNMGGLEQDILNLGIGKLGVPEVTLLINGSSYEITSSTVPSETPLAVTDLWLIVRPFPKLDISTFGDAEKELFSGNDLDLYKTTVYKRWLITPFLRWWIQIKVGDLFRQRVKFILE